MPYKHSVSLNVDKCKGCTHCLKHCPTEAIRIRGGHAVINASRCIDCGECIRVCPYKAKKASCDKLSDIPKGKWKIAVPAPALFGQFDNLDDIDYVLGGLLDYGFDDIFEVARSAEIVSDYTRRYMKKSGIAKPVISSACPVIERLISLRYPYLAGNLLPILPPMEIAAKEAKENAISKHPGMTEDDIATVFISPCPAKVSYVKNRSEGKRSNIDFVVSMSDIYFELLGVMKKKTQPVPVSRTGMIGLGWASSGGEATAVFNDKYLAADGIENVMRVLEEMDNGSFPELEFVELDACPGGCVGGVMTVANPFIAKARLQSLRRYLPVSQNWASDNDGTVPDEISVKEKIEYKPVSLGESMDKSIKMMSEMEKIRKRLPGIDCGSCGAPTCSAFASDVVRGDATIEECIVFMRKELESIRGEEKSAGGNNDGT